jgi:hypothetical protein
MDVDKFQQAQPKLRPRWLADQIAEIRNDAALRIFGALIAITHSVTIYFWISSKASRVLSSETDPICWPGLDFCFNFPRLPIGQVDLILSIYGYASIAIALLFFFKSLSGSAWAGLFGITVFKFAVMSLDIRTALNAHSIIFIVSAAFLFLPHKRFGIRISLIAIYFCAGILKLNADWLSGDNLSRLPSYLQIFPIKFLTIYVVILELGIVWLLLSRHASVFWIAFVQLVIFQSVAMSFIGFYFPTLMLCLLMIFPLDRFLPKPSHVNGFSRRSVKLVWGGFGLGFAFFQVFPYLISKEPAYTGEGKYFALHMFDSVMQCEPKVNFLTPDQTAEELTFFPPSSSYVGQRLMCNPISLYWRARAACKNGLSHEIKPVDFDLNLIIKKRTDEVFRPLIAIKNFCAANLQYKAFTHNEWILIE